MPRGGKTRFKPGQSGNPRGRPRGVPDRRNLFHWVSAEDKQAVFEKCVSLAKDGDPTCLKLVIERIAPVRKSELAPIELPDGNEPAPDWQRASTVRERRELDDIQKQARASMRVGG